ncbi:MAG: ATP-binding cassette domain-containing protein [Gudongella sp.]|nr:ATP-binding cassette domain-containing protein [Gudongella sp.]
MLKIKNLYKTFNINTEYKANIFDDFNLTIEKNTCTSIVGANGCGKSTLLNLISGNLMADNGSIIINNHDITKLPEEKRSLFIGRVYQNPSMGVSPSLTILENLSLANKKGENFSLKKLIQKKNMDKYIEMLLDLDLGLENKLNTQVKFLSGGQRQSLSLIMATMKLPDILLLDEHTAALDPKTSHVVMQKTQDLLEKHNITTIMVSHHMGDAIKYSQRLIMLDKGEIVLDKASINVTETELLEIYRSKFEERIA